MIGNTAPDGTDIWAVSDTTLLAVSNDTTYIADLPPAELERIAAEILKGAPVTMALSEARKIPHKKIVFVSGDEKKREVEFQYHSLRATVTSQGFETFKAALEDDDLFREILESCQRHFGPKATLKRVVLTPLKATIGPIIVAGFVALCTWALAGGLLGSENFRQGGRNHFAKVVILKIVGVLGTTGVIAIGSLAILACAWWGYKRFKDPPITIIVKPK